MSIDEKNAGGEKAAGENARRRRACDELAVRLSDGEEGLATARLLQAAGLLGREASEASEVSKPAEPAAAAGLPKAVGDWLPLDREGYEGDLAFGHPDGRVLPAVAAAPRRRLCLIGESAAAGFLYAPRVTPALYLERILAGPAGPDAFEVIDLARPGQSLEGLLQMSADALQLHPDLLVIFAGNNWLADGPVFDRPSSGDLDLYQEHADLLAREGIGALSGLVAGKLRRRARAALERLARIAESSRADGADGANGAATRVVFIVPESNLVDFETLHPVFWLPGDGVARWYGLHERAVDSLRERAWESAEAVARGMIEVDGGACATSHRLLAAALLGQGREDEAHRALLDHLDAACWDERFRRASATPTHLREEILAGCRQHGFDCVDLPEVFARSTGTPSPGRRLFLDHSHLTADGMRIAMAAVAETVLGTAVESLVDSVPLEVPARVEALARIHAGLYNAHLNRPVDGGPPPVDPFFASAVEICAETGASLRDYLEAMIVPGRAFLSAACRRNWTSAHALEPFAWLPSDLNGDVLDAMRRALAAPSPEASDALAKIDEIDRLLVVHHAPGPAGRDLAVPRYRERDPEALSQYVKRQATPALFRARWPVSTFYLIAEGGDDLEVDLTLRIPLLEGSSSGEPVRIELDGEPLGTIEALPRWRRQSVTLAGSRLQRGIHRLSLRWPLPGPVGDAALATAARRLQLGLSADLHPVFGEVHALRVRVPDTGDDGSTARTSARSTRGSG